MAHSRLLRTSCCKLPLCPRDNSKAAFLGANRRRSLADRLAENESERVTTILCLESLTKWTWSAAHPQRDESGTLRSASVPGQGRRLLAPSSPEQNGPECRASGTPDCCPRRQGRSTPGKLSHCGTLRPPSPLEVCHGSNPSPLLRGRHSQRIGGCVSAVAPGSTGEDRGATIRYDDRGVAEAARVAVTGGVHTRGDGVHERVLETSLQSP